MTPATSYDYVKEPAGAQAAGHVSSAPPPEQPLSQTPQQPLVFTVNAVPMSPQETSPPAVFTVSNAVVVATPPTSPVANVISRPYSNGGVPITQTATIVNTGHSRPQLATIVGATPPSPSPNLSSAPQPALTANALASAHRRPPPSSRSYASTKSSGSSTLYATSAPNQPPTSSKSFSLQSMMESIQMLQDNMAGKMEKIRNEKKRERVDEHQAREFFPRMP